MTTARTIVLAREELATLGVWLHLRGSTRLARRAKIVLLAADGKTDEEIAERLRASRKTVSLWRRRFLESRLAGIEKTASRPSARKATDRERIARLILHKTLQERPAGAATWTVRSLAEELGIPPSTVYRVWRANGLKSRPKGSGRS